MLANTAVSISVKRLIGVVLACGGISYAHAAQPAAVASNAVPALISLAPHRAIYDLTLEERRGNSAMDAVRGRIVYDFSGSKCEGYALKFRQVTEMTANGTTNVSDMRTTSFEDDEGKVFRFNVQNYVNQRLDNTVDGQAERAGKSVSVDLKKPSDETVTLPEDVIFPTAQVKGILERAQRGETLYESKIYDGSDVRKVYSTLAVIGKKAGTSESGAFKDLKDVDRWPVTVSYFDPAKSGPGEQTPVYSLSFDIYANGISDNLMLDYGDFALKGRMTSLEIRQPGKCQ